jgi:hypothetical protein
MGLDLLIGDFTKQKTKKFKRKNTSNRQVTGRTIFKSKDDKLVVDLEPNKNSAFHFNLKSSSNEAHLDMIKTKKHGWGGEIIKKNSVTVDEMMGNTVLEQTKKVEVENSKVVGQKGGFWIRKRKALDFDIEEQKKLGVTKIEMENTEKRQLYEDEVEKKGFINQISQQESQLSVKSRSKLGENKFRMNLMQNCLDQKCKQKKTQGGETEESIMEQKLELVKEDKEKKDRVIVETCRLKGNLKEEYGQEHVRVSSKMEVKKTVIEVPEKKGKQKIARIEITNERRICVDDSSGEEGNYELNLVSKVKLETSNVNVVKQKSLAKDLLKEMQVISKPVIPFSYEKLQQNLDPFQVRKEVLREERKKEKGIFVSVKRDKKIRVIPGSEDEKMDTTAQENKKFINEHQELEIPKQVYQKALHVINIPNRTLQMVSNKFNGKCLEKEIKLKIFM